MKNGRSLAGRLLQYGALLLLVQSASGCSDEVPSNDATPRVEHVASNTTGNAATVEDGKLVVAFGDSLFAGYGLRQTEGFAPVLEHALAAGGVKARVFNAGVSGDTTAAGQQRLAFTLDGLSRKPDLVIVGLGGNDMLRGLNPEATRANLDAILTELKKRGIETVLTGMLAAPNLGNDYAESFNAIYPDLAKKHGIGLYPFFLDGVVGQHDLLLPDGVHPNSKGIQGIVARIEPMVEAAIRR